MLPKLVTTLAVGATVFGVVSASAAALDVRAGGIAQQSDPIAAACDDDGVVLVIESTREGIVEGVTVRNIAPECQTPRGNGQGFADIVANFELEDGTTVSSTTEKAVANAIFLGIRGDREITVRELESTQVTISDQIRGRL